MRPNDQRPPGIPRSALADTLLSRLTEVFPAAADPAAAPAMAAYMKDIGPFLGIARPRRRALAKAVTKDTAPPAESDCAALALHCWLLPEREYRYFAVDYLRRHVTHCGPGFLPVVRHLIVTEPWWDTIDALAAHTVGPLVAAGPGPAAVMDEWIGDENLWIARTALLHQLRYKGATDADRLFAYCLRQAGHPDLFIRKAIGWCLREYAKTDPAAVRAFVAERREQLSPLSVREALKNL
ncbi:DNA alkylation repair protein [Streptomyces sp. G-G2]|uniref:DNA alkylation repair protein n=1 Tax=Streptomyces sp. G-G2 TaxID=3046201 RepID=UPI0024BA3C7F|nr:DNA alkylation repair protein [Streptomyces sp. G-G2]MDJ0384859.1 DNA alkylation repair protein [Streptomyces sp. G-G2]